MRRPLVLLVAVVLAGSLAACAPGTGDKDDDGFIVPQKVGGSKVDVDTAELRRKKERAGIEDCVPGTGDPVDDGLPEVTLPCLGGGKDVDLSALRGPLVVNLWAQWCKPCRDELPILQDFHKKYGDQVQVLGVNFQDRLPDLAMVMAEQARVTFPLVADPGGELSAAEPLPVINKLPMWLFVDADGEISQQVFVQVKSEEQLVDLVEEHLDVTLS
ncbi:TlpA disulfide reductase family protein [Nocardioides speluncae]|uniref:TlpA disulfide reductase family protein n=1 Tax=Nocardioides speluncae TaxID=2670337 RepID=UPI000D6883C4|nr:TlpA disulfide reductase family protein [Nocardioides speluncae]